MKKLCLVILMAGLVSLPLAAFGDAPQGGNTPPPVSQALVREGDLAVRLANTLKVAETKDEARAEEALAALDIAPKSGWISDFPVTPDILAEIKASVDEAADKGRIEMDRSKADAELLALSRELGLPVAAASGKEAVPPGEGEKYAEEGAAAEGEYEYQPPSVINNYYYEEGPPVVTYYPPPLDYAYLYAWDPFPFWWNTYYFPGFFILRDFTVPVIIHNEGGTVNVTGGRVIVRGGTVNASGGTVSTTTKLVTNRIINRTTNKVVTINPVTRVASTARAVSRGAGFNRDSARGILDGRAARASGGVVTGGGNIRSFTGRERAVSGGRTGGTFEPAPSLRGRAGTESIAPANRGAVRGMTRNFDAAPSLHGRGGSAQMPAQAPSFRDRGTGGAFAGRGFEPAPSLRGNAGRGMAPSAAPPSITRGFGGPSVGSRGFAGQGTMGRSFSQSPAFSAPRGFGGGSHAFGGRSFGNPSFGGGGRSFGNPSFGGRSFGGGGCRGRC